MALKESTRGVEGKEQNVGARDRDVCTEISIKPIVQSCIGQHENFELYLKINGGPLKDIK